ncbi:hypothetical protein H4219_002908 [Mycoemilia scoparia]|uniref:Uncharacterized protein n=1 Tax=Mycoemilia scoparia TaxID=417184 RepID=A0A9W8DU60_9FUNG|nr:hypothetical protein H4219_002908 [Mycoemilia scoparia]
MKFSLLSNRLLRGRQTQAFYFYFIGIITIIVIFLYCLTLGENEKYYQAIGSRIFGNGQQMEMIREMNKYQKPLPQHGDPMVNPDANSVPAYTSQIVAGNVKTKQNDCPNCCKNWPVDDSWFESKGYNALAMFPRPNILISSGETVCVRIILPPDPNVPNNKSYVPLPGYPFDSIIVDLVSSMPLEVTVPVRLKPVDHYLNNYRQFTHVYEGEAKLFDQGQYHIDARLEWRGAQWNFDPPLEFVKTPELRLMMADDRNSRAFPQSVVTVIHDDSVIAPLDEYYSLPLCKSMDEPGRWIPISQIPDFNKIADKLPLNNDDNNNNNNNNSGSSGSAYDKEFYSLPPLAEDNRIYVPYHCRYRTIPYDKFIARGQTQFPVIHWFGDSNSRRAMRMFEAGGKYCDDPEERKNSLNCLCNDYPKDLYPDEWYQGMEKPYLYKVYASGIDNSEVSPETRGTAQTPHDPNEPFIHIYYRFTKGITSEDDSYWRDDINPQNLARYPKPNIVIYQGTTWDVYLKDFETFTHEVDDLIETLRTVYDPKTTRFIYRTAQFWCCRPYDFTVETRRFSRLRFQAYNEYMLYHFTRKLNAKVWNVQHLGESRHPDTKRSPTNLPCISGHSRSELLFLENQLFMNYLYN